MKIKKAQIVPYAMLALALAMLLFYMFKSSSLKTRLTSAQKEQKQQVEQVRQYEKLLSIDSLLVQGEYNSALNAYNAEFKNKDIDDVSGVELRIELAQQLLTMEREQHSEQIDLTKKDSLDSIQRQISLPKEIRQYDSLNFAIEKYKVQLANMRRRLQNTSVGEYLTFTNTKGSKMHYVGQVKNGMANGFGVALLNTGSRYNGEWSDNQRHGQGSFYWPDGEYYVGSYQNDKRNGHGTYYWPNGEKYTGDWKDDKRNGEGIFYGKDGNIVTQGVWKNDKLVNENQGKKSRR